MANCISYGKVPSSVKLLKGGSPLFKEDANIPNAQFPFVFISETDMVPLSKSHVDTV